MCIACFAKTCSTNTYYDNNNMNYHMYIQLMLPPFYSFLCHHTRYDGDCEFPNILLLFAIARNNRDDSDVI